MFNIIIFIIVVGVLITIHEFGHFLAARKSGVRVEKFALGFGPAILQFKKDHTQILICLFPLGGYVKMSGDSRNESTGKPYEFFSKSAFTKILIVFFGPFFNYLLAGVLFWIVAMAGMPYIDTVVGKVLEGSPAQVAGIKPGDRIIKVNNKKVNSWPEMATIIRSSKKPPTLVVKRKDKKLSLTVSLKKGEVLDEFGKKKKVPMIGITAGPMRVKKYNPFVAFFVGLKSLFTLTVMIIKGLWLIITGQVALKDSVAGPLMIYEYTSEAVKVGIIPLLHLMALLSTSLAVINLLPVPVLDGGHISLFIIEKIKGKPVSERFEEWFNRIGVFILSILLIFVVYNDIVRIRKYNLLKKQNLYEQKENKE